MKLDPAIGATFAGSKSVPNNVIDGPGAYSQLDT